MKTSLEMTTAPIASLTWRIALPMSTGMFFSTMFNVVDTLCAGWLGPEALAALSLSFPVFFILFAMASGLSQGATALLANAFGAGNEREAYLLARQTLLLAGVAGVSLSCAGLTVSPILFRLLGAETEYLRTALAYMNVILTGGIFLFLPMALNAALASRGRTRPYRNYLTGAFVANLVLNPLLMWGWGPLPPLGVSGIALSTVLVQAFGTAYLWRKEGDSGLTGALQVADFRPDFPLLRQILAQSMPAMLNMLTIALGIFVTTWFVKDHGSEAVAALGIASRIEQVILMPVIGLGAAALSIVGQNHGAGLPLRVREAWTTNMKYGVGIMLAGALLLAGNRSYLMALFTDDAGIQQHGSDYLLAASVTLCAYPVLFVTVFALQGMKRPAYGLWIGLYRQFAAPVAVIYLLAVSMRWGTAGIWWGVTIVTWSAAAVSLWHGQRVIGSAVRRPPSY